MNKSSEQGKTIHQPTTAEQIVSSILFYLNFNDWFKLDNSIKNSELISIFSGILLSLIRPNQSNVQNSFELIGLKFLTRIRLGFSHLNEHRFQHNFQDCMNPLCSWRLKMHCITFCTVIFFPSSYDRMNSDVSDNFEYLFQKTMFQKTFFYRVTHV